MGKEYDILSCKCYSFKKNAYLDSRFRTSEEAALYRRNPSGAGENHHLVKRMSHSCVNSPVIFASSPYEMDSFEVPLSKDMGILDHDCGLILVEFVRHP